MSRVQLALNVSNLEASIEFYSKMFGTTPHKLRPGYANFSISEPPLKLVLIETPDDVRGNGAAGALNHLGQCGCEVFQNNDGASTRILKLMLKFAGCVQRIHIDAGIASAKNSGHGDRKLRNVGQHDGNP